MKEKFLIAVPTQGNTNAWNKKTTVGGSQWDILDGFGLEITQILALTDLPLKLTNRPQDILGKPIFGNSWLT